MPETPLAPLVVGEEKPRFSRGFLDPIVIKAAQDSAETWGVPASITLAQFILESDWGLRHMGVYNFFGIKDLKWDPGFKNMTTKEYEHGKWITIETPFEDFDSVEHCFEVHGRLIAKSRYYIQAMRVKMFPDAFAVALTGVYATDPNYGTKLIQLMIKYDLYQYDRPVDQPFPVV